MGFFSSSTPEQEAARAERDVSREQLRAYRKALNNSGRHVREEGPAYYQMNEAVLEAEKNVPWWRR